MRNLLASQGASATLQDRIHPGHFTRPPSEKNLSRKAIYLRDFLDLLFLKLDAI
jgi:hypothetical protein